MDIISHYEDSVQLFYENNIITQYNSEYDLTCETFLPYRRITIKLVIIKHKGGENLRS